MPFRDVFDGAVRASFTASVPLLPPSALLLSSRSVADCSANPASCLASGGVGTGSLGLSAEFRPWSAVVLDGSLIPAILGDFGCRKYEIGNEKRELFCNQSKLSRLNIQIMLLVLAVPSPHISFPSRWMQLLVVLLQNCNCAFVEIGEISTPTIVGVPRCFDFPTLNNQCLHCAITAPTCWSLSV